MAKNPTDKTKTASAGSEKKGETEEKVPQLSKAGNSQRSRADRKKRKEEVNKVASILNNKESKALTDVLYNMLEHDKPMRLVRPVPVRSVEGHYAGQIRFDTQNEYVEVRTRPDPRAFVEITTQTTSTLATLPVEEINNIYSGPGGSNSTSTRFLCYQEPAILADGTYIRPSFAETNNSGGTLESFYGDAVLNLASGFHGLSMPVASVLTLGITNDGPNNATVGINIFKVNTNTKAQTLIQAGATLTAAANGAAAPTITMASAATPAADEILVIAVSVVASVPGQFVRFRDLTISPTVYTGFVTADVYSVSSFTIGQAVYGKSDARAGILDSFFTNSLLWAPVGMSSRLNVRQQVNTAGGLMLAAYLPSFVMDQTSATPSKAWEDIVAYKRSYPVKDALPFRTGAHASWIGMRIQDYEFRGMINQPEYQRREAASLPVNVFIAQKASSDTEVIRYFFDFQVNFEVQSINPLVTAKLGPCSPDFLAQFLALCALHDLLVGENPLHIDRIKKLVKKIASDPRVRQAAKFAIEEGVPFLLRHI